MERAKRELKASLVNGPSEPTSTSIRLFEARLVRASRGESGVHVGHRPPEVCLFPFKASELDFHLAVGHVDF